MNQADLKAHMKTLGVDWGASADAVKRAWRAAAKRAHPDIIGSGSTEQMALINAAYDILKDGVPMREDIEQHQTHLLRLQRLNINAETKAEWRREAEKRLADNNVPCLQQGRVARLLRRKPKWPLHVTHAIEIHRGIVEIILDSSSLPKGTNYIAFPQMVPKDHKLVGNGKLKVTEITSKFNNAVLSMEPAPSLNKIVFPDHHGLNTVISTRW